MNTYQPVQLPSGRWALEWFADGKSQGFTFGTYAERVDACFIAYTFARIELLQAPNYGLRQSPHQRP
jgi:hypothetical protein